MKFINNNKIIADVGSEVKKKLYDISHESHENMTQSIIRLIEKEHKRIFKK